MIDTPKPLTPEEAVQRLREDPRTIQWSLGQFILQFGLTPAECLLELQSGRLIAEGIPVNGGLRDVRITGQAILDWMATRRGRRLFHRGMRRPHPN